MNRSYRMQCCDWPGWSRRCRRARRWRGWTAGCRRTGRPGNCDWSRCQTVRIELYWIVLESAAVFTRDDTSSYTDTAQTFTELHQTHHWLHHRSKQKLKLLFSISFFCLFVPSFILSFVHLFFQSFLRLFVHSFILSIVRSFVYYSFFG